ncbi:hypothetical protein QWA68_009130 [Fusarium oxysporum]|nr:hypothetical protein QWA68_009130 [Fusarium oxysporum]
MAASIAIDTTIDIAIIMAINIVITMVITAIITGNQVRLGQLLYPTKESQKLAMSNDRWKWCYL